MNTKKYTLIKHLNATCEPIIVINQLENHSKKKFSLTSSCVNLKKLNPFSHHYGVDIIQNLTYISFY